MQINVPMLSLNCIKKTSWHKMITNVNCLSSAVRYPRCKVTSTQVNFDHVSACGLVAKHQVLGSNSNLYSGNLHRLEIDLLIQSYVDHLWLNSG